MKTSEIIAKYGQPGETKNFVKIKLPYPMRIAWDLKTTVTSMMVHKDAAQSLLNALNEILSVYGIDKIKALGIDIFGGCFNFRKMRGGNDWSIHSWALAMDLDPDRNQLKWTKERAQFAKPEYKPMIDIFEKHSWYNLGKYKNYDFMHFQFIKP